MDALALALQIATAVAVLRYYAPRIDGWLVPVAALVVGAVLVGLDSTGQWRADGKLLFFAVLEAVGGVKLLQRGAEKLGASMPAPTTVVNAPEAKMVAVESVRPPPPMFPPSESGLPQATLERP